MTEVLTVQSKEQLESMKVPQLKELVKQFKAEDTDCLQGVNGQTKKAGLVEALADHMGFADTTAEETTVKAEVEKEITEQAETVETPVAQSTGVTEETTGNDEVDAVLAELGLDSTDVINADEVKFGEPQVTEEEAEEKAEEKPKKKRTSIPMDAPIPVRNYRQLILGVYGNILEPLEEKDENGFQYEEVQLERFNPKAHESFRKTKGSTTLLYTQGSGTYLIAVESPEGEYEPVLEVTNRGRGHLRCKQLANILQLAHDQKKDEKIIDDELYTELTGKIELMEVQWEGLGA